MSTRIIEYACKDPRMPLVEAPSIVDQTPITTNGSSTQSSVFNAATNVVCVQSDEACNIKFGENPTATTSGYKIQAGGEQFFRIVAGASLKVAVLR